VSDDLYIRDDSNAPFPAIDRLARFLCYLDHGPDQWDVPHRKRASYHDRAHKLIRKVSAETLRRIYRRFNFKAMVR